MRPLVAIVSVAVCGSFVLFAIHGIRPFRTPYSSVRSMDSTRSYWVEWEEGKKAYVCHRYGWRAPVDSLESPNAREVTYGGSGGSLWIVRVPGIHERFLVFDSCLGAASFRRLVYKVSMLGCLTLVADIATCAERQGDDEGHVLDATFEDVDGDGVPELSVWERDNVYDEDGTFLSSWGTRMEYYVWDGEIFRKRYLRLDMDGPLVDLWPH
jgi:hypothetical protein